MLVENQPLESSFRDPSGFVYKNSDGKIVRHINSLYFDHMDLFHSTGLYDYLVEHGMLVSHEVVESTSDGIGYKTIMPVQIPYVSYPYEWCFSQLKDAALLTLEIQLAALERNMSLKDASAFNVQFYCGKPIFIDTLSFEPYQDGVPWVAYRQFCQHFLAPLALVSYCDHRLLNMLRHFIDGVPLQVASKLLPKSSYFSYSILAHIHLHASSQARHSDDAGSSGSVEKTQASLSRVRLVGLIESLRSAVSKLAWKQSPTEWGDYYENTNYTDSSMLAKETLVKDYLSSCSSLTSNGLVADFGANTGRFSQIASELKCNVVSHDIDEVAVESHYLRLKDEPVKNILPLIQDLSNPSPSLGWNCTERESFIARNQLDVGMALAIIHHIAISNNVPLIKIAQFFHQMCKQLIIEFVPKEDSQVARLLATRADIFPEYHVDGFKDAFSEYFETTRVAPIAGSNRTLFLFTRKM